MTRTESPDLLGLLAQHVPELAPYLRRLAKTYPDVGPVVALERLGFDALIDRLEQLSQRRG